MELVSLQFTEVCPDCDLRVVTVGNRVWMKQALQLKTPQIWLNTPDAFQTRGRQFKVRVYNTKAIQCWAKKEWQDTAGRNKRKVKWLLELQGYFSSNQQCFYNANIWGYKHLTTDIHWYCNQKIQRLVILFLYAKQVYKCTSILETRITKVFHTHVYDRIKYYMR